MSQFIKLIKKNGICLEIISEIQKRNQRFIYSVIKFKNKYWTSTR
jgi:hypothetical protein